MIEHKLLTHLNGKKLANPIEYEIVKEHRYNYLSNCNLLETYGCGRTRKQAKRDLLMGLDFISSFYINFPDEKLTKDAQTLKQKLLHHFGPEFVEVAP